MHRTISNLEHHHQLIEPEKKKENFLFHCIALMSRMCHLYAKKNQFHDKRLSTFALISDIYLFV